jgi:hypothetical protein
MECFLFRSCNTITDTIIYIFVFLTGIILETAEQNPFQRNGFKGQHLILKTLRQKSIKQDIWPEFDSG